MRSYSQSPLQLCLKIHTTSYSLYRVQILYTVKEKGAKPDRKPYHLPCVLRNLYRNLKSDNSQDYALKPERNYTFMDSASGHPFHSKLTSILPFLFYSNFNF
jgi:hypothetical protein